MRWDERLGDLFADLEQQADGLALVERDAEVAELARAEYARVDLAGRLAATLGGRLRLDVVGVGVLEGVLDRAGDGWLLLHTGTAEWVLRLAAVRSLRGLDPRAVDPGSRPVTARLGLASVLRGVAEEIGPVLLHGLDGTLARGELERVGADFVEVAGDVPGVVETVPFAVLAGVRSG